MTDEMMDLFEAALDEGADGRTYVAWPTLNGIGCALEDLVKLVAVVAIVGAIGALALEQLYIHADATGPVRQLFAGVADLLQPILSLVRLA